MLISGHLQTDEILTSHYRAAQGLALLVDDVSVVLWPDLIQSNLDGQFTQLHFG